MIPLTDPTKLDTLPTSKNLSAYKRFLISLHSRGILSLTGTTTGSANAYVLTPTTALTAYVAGLTARVVLSFTNTGAATLNISGLGAKSIKDQAGTALVANAMVSGQEADLVYDGTNFVLLNPAVPTRTELGYVSGVTSAIQTQINLKAALDSPTFTGDPKAPTPAAADNDTSIPTTAWVQTELKAPTTIGSVTPNTGKFTVVSLNSLLGLKTFSIDSTAGAITLTGTSTGLVLIRGAIANNNFCDLVLMQSFGTTVVVGSTTFGTPPARTYAQSGAELTLDLDASGNQGTYTGTWVLIQ